MKHPDDSARKAAHKGRHAGAAQGFLPFTEALRTGRLNLLIRRATATLFAVLIASGGCAARETGEERSGVRHAFQRERDRMVARQIQGRDIRDPRVLRAMRTVPRHRFVPEEVREHAYEDTPLPIGYDQTISQPYIVALMTTLVGPRSSDRALEIGTGSGYQAAILAEIVQEVYTIEIVPELAEGSRLLLRELGYENVHVRAGDGYQGWPEAAPFDVIVVTAAPRDVPRPLLDQLADGGRLIAPLGEVYKDQVLTLITRRGDDFQSREIADVRFVPMTGKALDEER